VEYAPFAPASRHHCIQGGHSSGKPGKVMELESGQGK